MTEPSFQQPTAETWTRAGLLTCVSVIIGLINQTIISSLFARSPFAVLVGFGTGGIIASAIQGAYWRRFITARLSWILVSMIAWSLLAIPLLWMITECLSVRPSPFKRIIMLRSAMLYYRPNEPTPENTDSDQLFELRTWFQ